ncbi:dihydroxyacetone kinase phosphoryl donor subunit DhaM [Amorphus orientalis]|uniref:phosphoenolpyruvate--glycerone phosphotransferase n=1 Tax=Amorphus orientalis TaxID=649198 RepID=A0AAE4ASK9_9HYPH|nr:dihydroxyacetone kinase phosphoryl donor subunit DhaM [Amorphus orientalis]MDQ0315343.1 dihydroxyacetone kinase phosphotransfer subunit [Amorphus orientalis]
MSDTSSEDHVAIGIVSHSKDVARGAADMVRQMVGDSVVVAFTGGNPDGGLGTDATEIGAMIEKLWRPAGVVVLVDLGGAEMNTEMAIESLPEERQGVVRIANAPIVEGAVTAGTMASTGASLAAVVEAAEELGG